MSCTKNPKKFLFFKWNGPHIRKPTCFREFGCSSWAEVEVSFECERCEVPLESEIYSISNAVSEFNLDIKKLKEAKREYNLLGWTKSYEDLKKEII